MNHGAAAGLAGFDTFNIGLSGLPGVFVLFRYQDRGEDEGRARGAFSVAVRNITARKLAYRVRNN